MERDVGHLNWLAKGYYFVSILSAIILLLPLAWIAMAHLLVYMDSIMLATNLYFLGNIDLQRAFGGEEGGSTLFSIFVMFFGFFIGFGLLASTAANYYCAKSIKLCKRHTFCLVISGLALTSFPFGTILGIFSFFVLMRDSVKKRFEENI